MISAPRPITLVSSGQLTYAASTLLEPGVLAADRYVSPGGGVAQTAQVVSSQVSGVWVRYSSARAAKPSGPSGAIVVRWTYGSPGPLIRAPPPTAALPRGQ